MKIEYDSISAFSDEIINIDNITFYLIRKGLMDSESIIDGDLKIIDVSRRNRNIIAIRKKGTSFHIKQPRLTDNQNIITVKKEALFYLLMQTDADYTILKEICPRILDFDDNKNIMITEYVPNARSLHDYFFSGGIIEKQQSSMLGKTIALCHTTFSQYVLNKKKLNFLYGTFYPPISITRPGPDIFIDISPAQLKLLIMLQKYPDFCNSLQSLYAGWRNETLIHGDIKWDNVIIYNEPNNSNNTKIKITDWESVSIGDPAWDIGGVFHEYIKFWLYSMPIAGIQPIEQLIASGNYPIQKLQLSIRAFWNTYVQNRKIEKKKIDELLVRSTRFCAARIVQSAYESLSYSQELSNRVVYMIQTSYNILKNTQDAVIHLLGIPLKEHSYL